MKCKKCGQELEIGVKFCPNCGEDCVSPRYWNTGKRVC